MTKHGGEGGQRKCGPARAGCPLVLWRTPRYQPGCQQVPLLSFARQNLEAFRFVSSHGSAII
jgi:hypothetical protein